MTTEYIRGALAYPSKAYRFLEPERLAALAHEWHDLQARFPEIAAGLLAGKKRKTIAASLRWDERSLKAVLGRYLTEFKYIIPAIDLSRRLYTKENP